MPAASCCVIVIVVGIWAVADVLRLIGEAIRRLPAAKLPLQRGEICIEGTVLQIASDLGLLRFCTAAPHVGSTPLASWRSSRVRFCS